MDKMDMINHPAHYADNCSIECIDCMEMIFTREQIAVFYLGNAFKYIWRWKSKNGKEDLKKAEWYLDRYYDRSMTIADADMRLREVACKLQELIDNIRCDSADAFFENGQETP